jgi:hypothetical protein
VADDKSANESSAKDRGGGNENAAANPSIVVGALLGKLTTDSGGFIRG